MFLCWSSPLSPGQVTRAFSKREALPVLYCRRKSIEVHYNDTAENVQQETVLGGGVIRLPDLSFNRLQIGDHVLSSAQKRAFGRFAAREAALNEEYWAAAWLRAEAHYEALTYMRHVDSFKRKYSEQEFYALKRKCAGRDGNSLKCSCIVAVKKEDPNVKRTALNSVVGTLDLSIRLFVEGEVFLGESSRSLTTLVQHKACNTDLYAYIANVCVSKFARRQGIATHMLFLATDIAVSSGLKHLFVHVNADNRPAQDLYRKTGFENHRGAMMELGEGLCKLRKMNFDSGPFHQFEKEISDTLEFLYLTQKELAACANDLCVTLDGSQNSYLLLGNFAGGQELYSVCVDTDDISYLVFFPNAHNNSEIQVKQLKVKLPLLQASEEHLNECCYASNL